MPPVAITWMPTRAAISTVAATVVAPTPRAASTGAMSRSDVFVTPSSFASRSRRTSPAPTTAWPSLKAMVAGIAPSAWISASSACAVSRFRERGTHRAGDAAREHPVGGLFERPRAERFGDARDFAIDDPARGLGGHVVRREAGPTRGQHHVGARAEGAEDRGGDALDVVGHERAVYDLASRGDERLAHRGTALIGPHSGRAFRAHGDDARAHLHGARHCLMARGISRISRRSSRRAGCP